MNQVAYVSVGDRRLTIGGVALDYTTGWAQRVVERLEMATSPATLLRLIRRTTLAEALTPRVLGVVDWAKRKGRTYGTILVLFPILCFLAYAYIQGWLSWER